MKKWYGEEYEFEIEVMGFLRGSKTERYCRNGEEIGDKYNLTRERVRQIKEKAIRRLRHNTKSKLLKSYLGE